MQSIHRRLRAFRPGCITRAPNRTLALKNRMSLPLCSCSHFHQSGISVLSHRIQCVTWRSIPPPYSPAWHFMLAAVRCTLMWVAPIIVWIFLPDFPFSAVFPRTNFSCPIISNECTGACVDHRFSARLASGSQFAVRKPSRFLTLLIVPLVTASRG